MKDVIIVDGARLPFGKYHGQFASISAVDLGVAVVKGLLKRNPHVAAAEIDQVIFGSALQAGNGQNMARQISVKSELPVEIPAFTVNEVCGSGLKAVLLARQVIQAGEAKLVLTGGTENMSLSNSMQQDGLTDAFENIPMGVTVERLVKEFGVSRNDQDTFALLSHQKAANSKFAGELLHTSLTAKLETIRPNSTLETLAELKTVFDSTGSITAGNASPVNDGAAALLLADANYAKENHLPALSTIKNFVEIGVEPDRMAISPISAIKKLLEKTGLSLNDIDRFEINEAFAASSLIIERELGLNSNRVNVQGGAIALGHPLGATGARLALSLAHQLKNEKLHYGIASLCIGGGLGLAVLLENPDA